MKKIFLGLAFLAATFTSTVIAQTNDNNVKAGTEQTRKEVKSFAESPLFTGITLSADQKTKLEEVGKKCMMQSNDSKESEKIEKNNKKNLTEEQKKQLKAQKEQAKKEAREKRIAHKESMLKDIKSILTPTQYTKFLENNFVYGNKGCGMKSKSFKQKDAKKGMGDRKGHRQSKGNRNNKGGNRK